MEIIILAIAIFIWFLHDEHQKKIKKAWKEAREFEPPNVHGSASFAEDDKLKAAGMFRKSGIPIGYSKSGKQIYFAGKTHLITFGGTGSGKTTQALIPVALTYPHSLLYLDGTGEGAAVTAHSRRRFGNVYQVNPGGFLSDSLRGIPSVGFNPIGPHWLNPRSITFGARSSKAAESVIRETHGDSYWTTSSRLLVQVVIMFLAESDPKNCHLGKVAQIIAGDVQDYCRFIYANSKNEIVRSIATRFASKRDVKSVFEVIENTRTETGFMLDEGTYETLKRNDIVIGDCKKRTVSIYPITPPGQTDGRLMNLLFGTALAELLVPGGSKRTLIIADEYRSMQYREGPTAFATSRKFNTQIWACLQDMGQLRELHGATAETLLANSGCVQFMSATDLAGSEYISSLCGEREIYSQGKSVSVDQRTGMPSISESINQFSRKLILPHEVRELNDNQQILFITGVRGAIMAERKGYYETSLRWRGRRNPYHKGVFG